MQELKTARLTLRKLAPEDAEAVVQGVGDIEVAKWLTLVPHPYTRADAEEFIAYVAQQPFEGFGIHAPEGFVGVIGIGSTLGYWLTRAAHGKGYATEAAIALVAHYFTHSEADHLDSGYFDGNAGSKNVLTKVGFRPVGEKSDRSRATGKAHVLKQMRLTRADWQSAHG
ncbi:MAG: GNAT family N-acetyltransferase [Rhodobacterales bacterium]|nr:MAG: GNAT family N-acetyltransferase [Rhodobacterales bacterium]